MAHRTAISIFLILAFGLAAWAEGPRFAGGSINGSVRTSDNHPAADVRIELQELRTGRVLAAGYTSQAGLFEFSNLRGGQYEIVVTSGLQRVREQVSLQAGVAVVNVMVPANRPDHAAGNSVSVAQLQVPKKARKALNRAQKALGKQDGAAAEKYLAEALGLYPRYAEALTLRAVMRIDAHRLEDARTDLEEALNADPGHAMSYIVLGATYNLLARYDDALRVLDRGLALSPRAWQAYFEMGKSFLGKGDFTAALRQLAKAETITPHDYAPLHLVKAHAYLALKSYPEAMTELQAFLDRESQGSNAVAAREAMEKVRGFVESSKK